MRMHFSQCYHESSVCQAFFSGPARLPAEYPPRNPEYTGEMDWLLYVVASGFVLFGAACVLLAAINLPGTWIMLGAALVIELLDWMYRSSEPSVTFGWWVLGAAFALAIIGELVEFLSGAAGSRFGGGRRRGMIGAVVGGIVGAIIFTPLVPIPIIGTLIGAVVGTFVGALIAEGSGGEPRTLFESIRPASGAAAGRVFGNLAKSVIAGVMWIMLSIAAFWP